jgi:hypothetical protein
MTIPAGWKLHPDNPAWIYEVANPTNMQPTPADPLAGQLGGEASYGTLDVDAATKEQKLYAGRSDQVYIDFPDFDQSGWSIIKLRLLPPWSPHNRTGFVQVVRHRVFAEHYPQEIRGNRRVMYETCLNISIPGGISGPGDCPFCDTKRDAIKAGLDKKDLDYLANFNPRVASIWQAIDMTDNDRLGKHFVQKKHENGQPMLDAANQPLWDVVPGRFRMGNELLGHVRAIMKVTGDPTHPDFGYTIAMMKQKTGVGDLDVDYKAQVVGGKERLPEQLRPVLGNLLDLEKEEISFSDVGVLRKVADSIRQKIGLQLKWSGSAASGSAAGWIDHPNDPSKQWLWNPATGQTKLRGT